MRTKTSRIVLSDPRSITLAALFWIAALILASLALPASAGAQTTTSDPLLDAQVTVNGNTVTVSTTDTSCTLQVSQDATVVLNDGSGSLTISAAQNTFEVTSNGQQLTITSKGTNEIVTDSGDNLPADSATFTVNSSEGVTCGNSNSNSDSSGDKANDGKQANNGDDLLSLSCEELLKRFRAGDDASGQYGDDTTFADPDVRKRVEECLKKEIVQGTAADEKLPDTGGVSLLALAVLGVVSTAACVSVVRGVRRGD